MPPSKAKIAAIVVLVAASTLLVALVATRPDPSAGAGSGERSFPGTAEPSVVQPAAVSRQAAEVPSGRVPGRVSLRLPGDSLEGVPATLRWIVRDERTALEDAPAVSCARDGSFVIETAKVGTLVCAAQHDDGVATTATARLPADFLSIEMPPAGKIEVRLPGNEAPFELLLKPGDGGGDASPMPRRVQVHGSGALVRCGGIPLPWRAVKVSIVWSRGGRSELGEAPLRFREWTVVTLDVAARAGSVLGRVVDETGRAVEGARIWLYRRGGTSAPQPESWDAESAADGRFRFVELPLGELTLAIGKKGFVGHREDLGLAPGQVLDIGDRVLDAGAIVRGSVEFGDASAEDVTVTINKGNAASAFSMAFGVSTRPDRQGRFEFRGVGPGEWTVAAFVGKPQPLKTPWSGRQVVVGPNERDVVVSGLSIVETVPWQIALRVPVGRSLRGSPAVTRGVDAPWATFGVVGDDGALRMAVGSGRFLLGLRTERAIRWLAVLTTEQHDLDVPNGGITLTSREPIDDKRYYVTLAYRSGATWPAGVLPLDSGMGILRADGCEYHFDHLVPGSYEVRIQRELDVRTAVVEVLGESEARAPWPFDD